MILFVSLFITKNKNCPSIFSINWSLLVSIISKAKLGFSILFTISTDREKLFLDNPDIYKGHVEFVEPEPSNNVNLHELY